MPNIEIEGINEADLRIAVWMRNSKKTKKSICEYLKIKYNTVRLDKILTSFEDELVRVEELKKTNRRKVFTEEEEALVVKRYSEVGSMAKVAEEYLVSPAKIKTILLKKQVPIKSRSKILVDHIQQELDIPFNIGDQVFSKPHKTKCVVQQKYDEEYIEYLKNGTIKTVDNPYVTEGEELEGIHYSVYWILDDGKNMGLLSSAQSTIKSIENTLVAEGQEFYKVKIENSDNDEYYSFCKRGDLYKI
jgi:hypothetical protein